MTRHRYVEEFGALRLAHRANVLVRPLSRIVGRKSVRRRPLAYAEDTWLPSKKATTSRSSPHGVR